MFLIHCLGRRARSTPVAIQLLMRRCLRKDLDRRLRDIGDVRIEIEDAITEPEDAVPISAAVESASFAQRALPWTIAVIAIAVAAFLYAQFQPAESRSPVHTTIPFLGSVLDHPDFRVGNVDTHFLERFQSPGLESIAAR